jgi:hypothetical protein
MWRAEVIIQQDILDISLHTSVVESDISYFFKTKNILKSSNKLE